MSDVRARVLCRIHENSVMGIVRVVADSPRFETRSPRWRDRFGEVVGLDSRNNERWNIGIPTIEKALPAWCLDCGRARDVEIAELLAAFEGRRSKVILI